MMWDYGWHGWFLGPFAMILFWGLAIAAIVLVVRWFSPSGHGPQAARTHLDILRERFARGEIGKDEFEERRRVLGD
ncbi:MAG: SHOCT domain-containing protein [Candidatus Tectomicrobia bacterium]|uniref:SHOCT domain-containing protein n=1 Tax=Tectimicrobiota bacterium TaxID=2528274 RepID=A0A932MMS0_UNCTE|nr:SHOCT domain-containing protein [Candidatus Tectomicrobia bacterium]